MTDTTALSLAIRFHETYERLAPSFGYETRTDTRQFDPESKNGRLMVAVCAELAGLVPTPPPAPEVEAIRERDARMGEILDRPGVGWDSGELRAMRDVRTLLRDRDVLVAELARVKEAAPYALAREWEALHKSTYAKYRDMAERAEAAERKRDEAKQMQAHMQGFIDRLASDREGLMKALKALSFAAQISGGVAGRDDGLVAAIDEAARVLKEVQECRESSATPPAAPSELARELRKLIALADEQLEAGSYYRITDGDIEMFNRLAAALTPRTTQEST